MNKQDLERRRIAYFTMEIGLDSRMQTYSGGLGILSGDTIKSCADMGVAIIAVTLLHERGYFTQQLDAQGNQTELPASWDKREYLKPLPERVSVFIEGREVVIQAWEYIVKGIKGDTVPVYFLDTNLAENSDYDKTLTSYLYGGDRKYRLCQEIVLGIGGVRMIEALGYTRIDKYHMNEGHAGLLTVELLGRTRKEDADPARRYDPGSVRKKCIFTTHTPVAAGHDKFPVGLVKDVLRSNLPFEMPHLFIQNNELNMTLAALNLSEYVNGVAKRHGEVTQEMFPGYVIDSITNGIHLLTWAAPSFRKLYDKHIPGWQSDYLSLRYALNIPRDEVWQAHLEAKRALIDYVNNRTEFDMDYDTFTIGFARRATPYKRADLLLSDIGRLAQINAQAGKIQIVYAGKSHPRDEGGKDLIRKIFARMKELLPQVKIAYLANYDMELGRLVTSGSDLWLNNPLKPLEASGTSGMKACLNGIPNLSVLDGWWIEGCIEHVTGWAIGRAGRHNGESAEDAADLYRKLEETIIPLFYRERDKWIEVMRHTIALNASFFNTQRMVQEYVLHAYL